MIELQRKTKDKPLRLPSILRFFFFGAAGALASLAALPFSLTPFGVAAAALYPDDLLSRIALALGAAAGYAASGRNGLCLLGGLCFALGLRALLAALLPRLSRRALTGISCAGGLILGQVLIASFSGFLIFDLLTGAAGVVCGVLYALLASRSLPALESPAVGRAGVTQTECAALLLTGCLLLLPLASFSLYGVAPARIVGMLLILTLGAVSGAAAGGMAGVMAGVILSFAPQAPTHIIAAYAVGGIAAGLCGTRRRRITAAAFLFGVSVIAFYLNPSLQTLATLCEGSLSSTLFLLLPERLLLSLTQRLRLRDGADGQAQTLCRYLDTSLQTASRQLGRLSALLSPAPPEAVDPERLLREKTGALCKGCPRALRCYGEESADTADVFAKGRVLMREREILRSDLPPYFSARCLQPDRLLSIFNEIGARARALDEHACNAQRNRTVLAAQFASLSDYLSSLGSQIGDPLHFDEALSARAGEYFLSRGWRVDALFVYTDPSGSLTLSARLRGSRSPAERQTLADLSSLLAAPLAVLSLSESREGWELLLGPRERLALETGAAQVCKPGESICGDVFTLYRLPPARRVLSLADGMGSGLPAHRQADLTASLLRALLDGGFAPEKALPLLNSTLMLSDDEQSFSTLDLCTLDLTTGRADLYKSGAAPTLLLRGGKFYEIPCSSLPLGILADSRFLHRSFRLKAGDLLVLASDGVELGHEQKTRLLHGASQPLSELAREILDTLPPPEDDRTLVLCRLRRR